ncbi:MAG: deoxyuridine 5'-triphosphate nucleotidohydrolase [Candidatus Diapherotrites archaeon]|nr:deoxyuridine 5'-triphosphate nucleotidohydrolase [Candidatus Diapherotrites archaeon]
MILHDSELKKLIKNDPPLVKDYISLKHQLQPNGFDLTGHELFKFKGAGSLDFSNKERVFPETEPVVFEDMWALLEPGIYKVKTNEYVNLPDDVIAFAQTRSSLLRMGAFTVHGFWDAGFHGKSEFSLVVQNPHGLRFKQNARVAQIMFIRLNNSVDEAYSGMHKGLE